MTGSGANSNGKSIDLRTPRHKSSAFWPCDAKDESGINDRTAMAMPLDRAVRTRAVVWEMSLSATLCSSSVISLRHPWRITSALQLITGVKSSARYNTQSSVGVLASAAGSSSSGTTMAAGTALTAVEDEDGSENPTSGRLPMCGARDGPKVGNEIGVCNVIEGSLPLDLALGGKGVL